MYSHIFNFIWNNKDRIKRKTIIGKIEEGGTGIVDVLLKFQALKAAWIPRFLRNKGRSILGEHLDHLLKSNNIDFEYMLKLNCVKLANFEMFKNLPLFYKEIFMYFNQCKKITEISSMNINDVLQEPIWNNRHLVFDGKPMFFKNWIKSNILYVKDLFTDNGFKSLYEISD